MEETEETEETERWRGRVTGSGGKGAVCQVYNFVRKNKRWTSPIALRL